MWKIVPAVILALFASACVSVVPTYDEELYKYIEAVNNDIDRINAAVGAVYKSATPFSKVESYYIGISANLSAAIAISDGRATYLRSKISGKSAKLVTKALQICQQAVELQLNRHRKSPIDPKTLEKFAVKQACTWPKLMEERLKEGA